eukprot:TRINITY_DN14265_c0_g2_i5.p1 TRINITY_DN14265_c0_g2~~TRINITY_DN14265_c0_g2_i5.p1  ORF type:complete len:115 (-),score=3.12 TRINITY_DN14265_c0_g2_i5:5-349(-)
MKLAVYDPDWTKIVVKTNGPLEKNYRCRLHPKVDSKAWSKDGTLGLKEVGKGFPYGSDNAPVILRWKLQSAQDNLVPFTVNFWPNPEDGRTTVDIQVEHNKEDMIFKNVSVSIP